MNVGQVKKKEEYATSYKKLNGPYSGIIMYSRFQIQSLINLSQEIISKLQCL